ncbi:MAG: hypothetical protein ABIR59_10165 [Gemmatimonadales bacterium]
MPIFGARATCLTTYHARVSLALAVSACATPVSRTAGYIDLVRPDQRPPLVGAKATSDSLWGLRENSLTGDGIAESRRADLQSLVERFSPTLVLPRNDHVTVAGTRYWMLPTNQSLYTDTLRVDMIRAAPLGVEDTVNIALKSLTLDSLKGLVNTASGYRSDPDLIANAYFDFPGNNPRQWWHAYGRFRTGPDSARWATPTVYAHPFIEPAGRLAIQYWFFYPVNDFIANHEGDWEHIVVVAKPGNQAIDEVHYYFHQRSVVLPQRGFKPDTVDGTHPVVYVGGRMYHVADYPVRLVAGDRNEGSHGSYPFPGEWEGVAGLGGSESVQRVDKDSLRAIPYHRFDVILTPEPIRIDYVAKPEVLREWAWLLLPVRWGFPVSPSTAAGIGMDVGNRAPYGPAFNAGWNRTAPGLMYPGFSLRRIPKVQSYLEDLLQPWYYLYIFRTPRYVHDSRDTVAHAALERLGLVPRSGAGEAGIGTTALGMSYGYPGGDFGSEYETSRGFLLQGSLWAKARLGALEIAGGYQRFRRSGDKGSKLFVYPLTVDIVARAPGARLRPYAGLGGGVYGWQAREAKSASGTYLASSGWSWGWNAQAGMEYYLRPRVALDVGVRLHNTHLDRDAAGIAGDHLRFVSLWIGHYFRF